MRRIWLVVIALIVPAACRPASEASDPAVDEAAIRAVLQGLEATWNAGDLDANAEFVDSDMVASPPGEPWIKGEAANRQVWEEMLATTDNEWHPSAEEIWVSGDLAVAWGRSTGFVGPKGGEVAESSGNEVWVFRRGTDGVWRMLLETWADDSNDSGPVDLGGPQAQGTPDTSMERGRAGQIQIGDRAEEVIQQYDESDVRRVDLRLEGVAYPGLEIRVAGSERPDAIVVQLRTCEGFDVVRNIRVNDSRFRTSDGIGIGTTVGELKSRTEVWFTMAEGSKLISDELAMIFYSSGDLESDETPIERILLRLPFAEDRALCEGES